MLDPATALTAALDNSTKVANTPLFSTVIDKLLGFRISEWAAQGDTIKKQILDGYEEAKQKGLGIQYVSAFRANANLLNTGVKASKYIDPGIQNSVSIDNDVFWGLIEHSKEISNEQMQDLIAKIIAGEYNAPGTYSMSTLQILKSLSKDDLRLLAFFGSFYLPDHGFFKSFFSMDKEAIKARTELKIDYSDFLELQNLGLIQSGDYTVSVTIKKDSLYRIIMPARKGVLVVKAARDLENWHFPSCNQLTTAGREILQHLEVTSQEVFEVWLKDYLKKNGLEVEG